jgi:pilus assembly protein Flp/PilA
MLSPAQSGPQQIREKRTLLRSVLLRLVGNLRRLVRQESGQDIVEYALLVALIAFSAAAGIKSVATGIKTAYTNISTALSTDIT